MSTAVAAEGGRRRYNAVHGAAIIAHGLSYLTTLLFIQWVWPEGGLTAQSCAAYTLEFLFYGMKSALWNSKGGDDAVGYAGVGIDGLINAGGILPQADKILMFPPIAAVLSIIKVDVAQMAPVAKLPGDAAVTSAGLFAAIVGGILLSAAPHRIWRAAERRRE